VAKSSIQERLRGEYWKAVLESERLKARLEKLKARLEKLEGREQRAFERYLKVTIDN